MPRKHFLLSGRRFACMGFLRAFRFQLVGKYEHDMITIPVSLEITFHSNLDSLLKEGLKAIRKKKKLTNKLGEMK